MFGRSHEISPVFNQRIISFLTAERRRQAAFSKRFQTLWKRAMSMPQRSTTSASSSLRSMAWWPDHGEIPVEWRFWVGKFYGSFMKGGWWPNGQVPLQLVKIDGETPDLSVHVNLWQDFYQAEASPGNNNDWKWDARQFSKWEYWEIQFENHGPDAHWQTITTCGSKFLGIMWYIWGSSER